MKTTIPLFMRKEMEQDTFYSTCALYGQHNHVCGGSITWEHALRYAGKSIQEPWAIVPLCERGHAVNNYQDAGTMIKELNQWVAFNRATDNDLAHYPKATPSFPFEKARLNKKYGVYDRKVPQTPLRVEIQQEQPKKIWYPLNIRDKEMVQKAAQHYRDNLEINYNDHQVVSELIRIGAESLISQQ